MAVDAAHWVDRLPLILLGLRSALREDLGCSVADLVYGQPLRLPGEFFECATTGTHQSDFVKQLQHVVGQLKPQIVKHHAKPLVFVQDEVSKCSHVFVRIDSVKRPLQRPYDGPYEVLERHDKFLDLLISGKCQRISIDRLKPAFLCDDSVANHPLEDTKTKVTPSGHRIRFLV